MPRGYPFPASKKRIYLRVERKVLDGIRRVVEYDQITLSAFLIHSVSLYLQKHHSKEGTAAPLLLRVPDTPCNSQLKVETRLAKKIRKIAQIDRIFLSKFLEYCMILYIETNHPEWKKDQHEVQRDT